MATPMTVKIPEPMTAPMPRAVSETGPSVLRRARSGRSDSAISLSIDLVAKICLGSVELLKRVQPAKHMHSEMMRQSYGCVSKNAMAASTHSAMNVKWMGQPKFSAWTCRVQPS